jgi:hypothetical protein
MLGVVLVIGMLSNACPLTSGIGVDGALFSSQSGGWYRTSPATLTSVLHTGCYNDANNPAPVTSVRLVIVSGAPQSRVDLVFSILEKEGWPKTKVSTGTWTDYPEKPR